MPDPTFLRIPLNEWKRKAVHMGCFGFAFLLPYITPTQAVLGAIGAFCFNAFLLPKLMPSILRPDENGKATGLLEVVLYPAAILAILLSSGVVCGRGSYCTPDDRLRYIFASWFVLAIIDGWLGLCYKVFPDGKTLPWNPRKTVNGFRFSVISIMLLIGLVCFGYELSRNRVHDWFETYFAAFLVVFVLLLILVLLESLWFGIADNLTLPFVIGAGYALVNSKGCAAILFHDGVFYHQCDYPDWIYWGVPLLFSTLAWLAKKITLGGALFGFWIAAVIIHAEPMLFVFLLGFFIFGVVATRFGSAKKAALGIGEARSGRRGIAEIFGASAMMVWLTPLTVFFFEAYPGHYQLNVLLIVISPVIAKTMDTVSSEIGKAVGGKTISLMSFRLVPPGTAGAVSLAGTLCGLGAAALLAALIFPLHWGGFAQWGILIGIAVAANLFESYWGTWADPRGLDDGPHTNFLMTLFAAVLAWFVWGR